MSPIPLFNRWLNEELLLPKSGYQQLVVYQPMGTDGYPNARFVSLKEVVNDCFIITGRLTSREGFEITQSNKVALTFWWTQTERQVRLQGVATRMADELADKYFSERNKESQIVSIVSEQGQPIQNLDLLIEKYQSIEFAAADQKLKRP